MGKPTELGMDGAEVEGSGSGLEIDMNPEDGLAQGKSVDGRATYKSFKKKYRKMRIKFDEKMRESNTWYMEEQLAVETARRLAEENDRLLDLLLDVNNSAQIPAEKRIELSVDTPSLSAVPALISAYELSKTSEFNTPAGQAIYNEILSMLDERAAEKAVSKLPKSLALLMTTTPHISFSTTLASYQPFPSLEPLEGYSAPITYLTLDQMDDYISEIDASLGTVVPHQAQAPTQQDLVLKNPHSVYNWLRRNEPKIFLQDGEGSEKSLGKPGSLRGAGKRASMPAQAKPDTLEVVEEDSLGYGPPIIGPEPTKGKRKRDDDGGYHPKSGRMDEGKVKKPRPRKKKSEGSGEMTSSTTSRKSKGKARASSPMVTEQSSQLGPV